MKCCKESGASYRKKRKMREEENRKSEGSLLKYFETTVVGNVTRESSSSSVAENEEMCASLETALEHALEIEVKDASLEAESATVQSPSPADQAEPVSVSEEVSESEELEPVATGDWQLASPDPGQELEAECDSEGSSNLVDLKDVGQWPTEISNHLRMFLVRQGSAVVQHIDCDFAEVFRRGVSTKGAARKLTREWFFRKLPNGEKMLRSWMVYSPSKSSLFCFCCRLFGNVTVICPASGFNSENGFNKWWKLNPKLEEHESTAAHVECFTAWKSLEIRILRGATIDKAAEEGIRSEEKKWRDLLSRMLDIIKFLAKQNLALRGHREYGDVSDSNRGNFLELVQLLAKYDPVLREHFTKVKLEKKNAITYMSPLLQNEFINLLGDQVRKQIVQQVRKAKYFCVIFDSTPDISHKDQTSQVLRYVRIDGPQVSVVESFVDFIETKGKSAEELAQLIVDKIGTDGLDIQNCRGQAYDNAAVMAGLHTGVQARIKAINPKAQFIACTNHSLNLVGVHAAAVAVDSVTFFGTLEQVFVFFSSSTHRWDVLTAATGQGVKRLVETRWSARYAAVNMMKTYYSKILDVLDQLTDTSENVTTRSDAGLLLKAMQSFPFLCYLGFWGQVLCELNDAQSYLQMKGLDLHQCAIKIRALEAFLKDNRDNIISHGFSFSKNLCEELGIEIEPRRRRKHKQQFGDISKDANSTYEESYEQELRREMFASLDKIIQEITSRFQQLQELDDKFCFLKPSKLLDAEYTCDLGNAPDDINKDEFQIERRRLREFINASQEQAKVVEGGPLELLQFIQQFNLDSCVPNIVIMLRLFMTVGISVASCERSFSKLKLIKNYLRSTMSQLRLSNLAILSIEQEITNQVDFDDVISEFSSRKARRVLL